MNAKRRQSGLTLTEMAVVVGVTALLAGLALPGVRMVMESFESGDSAASMISSALASARALLRASAPPATVGRRGGLFEVVGRLRRHARRRG